MRKIGYNFNIDPDVLDAVRLAARAEGISTSEWLRRAAQERLSRQTVKTEEAGNDDSVGSSGSRVAGGVPAAGLPGVVSVQDGGEALT